MSRDRAARRARLEVTWVAGVVLFTLARFGAAWGALADHARWAVWTFGVIDILTAVPYALGTARLVTSLIDRKAQAAARWGIVASGSFLAPYAWLAWVGRDGSLPMVVYVAIGLCVVCFGANAVLSVRRKVREERPPLVAPRSSVAIAAGNAVLTVAARALPERTREGTLLDLRADLDETSGPLRSLQAVFQGVVTCSKIGARENLRIVADALGIPPLEYWWQDTETRRTEVRLQAASVTLGVAVAINTLTSAPDLVSQAVLAFATLWVGRILAGELRAARVLWAAEPTGGSEPSA